MNHHRCIVGAGAPAIRSSIHCKSALLRNLSRFLPEWHETTLTSRFHSIRRDAQRNPRARRLRSGHCMGTACKPFLENRFPIKLLQSIAILCRGTNPCLMARRCPCVRKMCQVGHLLNTEVTRPQTPRSIKGKALLLSPQYVPSCTYAYHRSRIPTYYCPAYDTDWIQKSHFPRTTPNNIRQG